MLKHQASLDILTTRTKLGDGLVPLMVRSAWAKYAVHNIMSHTYTL